MHGKRQPPFILVIPGATSRKALAPVMAGIVCRPSSVAVFDPNTFFEMLGGKVGGLCEK